MSISKVSRDLTWNESCDFTDFVTFFFLGATIEKERSPWSGLAEERIAEAGLAEKGDRQEKNIKHTKQREGRGRGEAGMRGRGRVFVMKSDRN